MTYWHLSIFMEDLPMHFLFLLKWRLQGVGSGSVSQFVSGIGILIRKRMEMLPDPSWIRKLPAKIIDLTAYFTLFVIQSAAGHTVCIYRAPRKESCPPLTPYYKSPPADKERFRKPHFRPGSNSTFFTSGAGQQRCLRLPQVNNLLFSLWKVQGFFSGCYFTF